MLYSTYKSNIPFSKGNEWPSVHMTPDALVSIAREQSGQASVSIISDALLRSFCFFFDKVSIILGAHLETSVTC